MSEHHGHQAALPSLKVMCILPDKRGPMGADEVFDRWLETEASSLLVVSGSPGTGKTTAIEGLQRRAPHIHTVDNFPSATQTFSDISSLLREVLTVAGAKLVVATQVRFGDARTGTLANLETVEPWAVTVEPVSIEELRSLATSMSGSDAADRLQAILELDTEGHDTYFLRSRQAIDLLMRMPPATSSAYGIHGLIEEYVVHTLQRADVPGLNPIEHQKRLSEVCYNHFLGRAGVAVARGADRAAGSDRNVSLDWFASRLEMSATEARVFANASPFLTLQLDASTEVPREYARVILPDTLAYELFVAYGLASAIRAGEELKLSSQSLRDLSDGLVVLFLSSKLTHTDLEAVERYCRSDELSNHDRLFLLYFLETEELFAAWVTDAGASYHEWLEEFIANPPNTFCWKMAAYQLLLLGKIEPERYIVEVEREGTEERASELAIQAARSGGSIDRQLIERLRHPGLHACRVVTARRMGLFGSQGCVLPLADAMADRDNSKFETAQFRQAMAKILAQPGELSE